MKSPVIPILVAIVIQLGLGLVVFQANSRRKGKSVFLAFINCDRGYGWAACALYFRRTRSKSLQFAIREASVMGAVILTRLQFAATVDKIERERSWREYSQVVGLVVRVILVVAFCQTRLLPQRSAIFPSRDGASCRFTAKLPCFMGVSRFSRGSLLS